MQYLAASRNLGRMVKLLVAVSAFAGSVVVSAAESKTDDKIAIDMSELTTTKNEVAVLQVLSEICPPMLTKSQQQGFSKAYNIELQRLMPSISDPRVAVQYLSSQQDYKQILADTRQWTLSYPKSENKEVCTELATAQY